METPLSELLPEKNQVDASANFERPPENPPSVPVQVPVPSGPGQGLSFAERFGKLDKKEFFGAYMDDFKSTIVVFVLLLIGISGVPNMALKSFPSLVSIDGRSTLLGTVVLSIVLSILFIIIKISAKI